MKKGFTLIELLAVVTIMAIILVAAIPVFQSMGKRDLGTAAAQLRATLRLARQYAVTQRKSVYVVFPGRNITYSSSLTNHLNKCLRAYAVMVQRGDGASTYEYITDWKFLPQGVCFDDGPTIQPTTRRGQVFVDSTPLPFPNSSDPSQPDQRMSVIRYYPDGQCARFNASQGGWEKIDVTAYITTSHIYSPNSAGNGIDRISDIAGVTNGVRARRYTGQVDIRDGTSD